MTRLERAVTRAATLLEMGITAAEAALASMGPDMTEHMRAAVREEIDENKAAMTELLEAFEEARADATG